MRPALACLVALAALALPAWAAEGLDIRVVLSDNGAAQTLSGTLDWFDGTKLIGRTHGDALVELSGGNVRLRAEGKDYSATSLRAQPPDGQFSFSQRSYRGRAELFVGRDGGVVVLNVLPLEGYLKGVVASEMPPGWPEQALLAQAVAARTYAVSRMAARQQQTYDVYSTVSDQAYRGIAGEDPRTNRAVDATAGQILTYQGYPIVAYFCSDAGGFTRQGDMPYLQAVPSEHTQSPHNSWTIALDAQRFYELLAALGKQAGTVTALTAENDPASGHLLAITVQGSLGSQRITGPELRKAVGYNAMKSTRARIELPGGGAVPVLTDPAVVPQPSIESVPIYPYQRPWVASRDGLHDLKLRELYCHSVESMYDCRRDLYVYAGPADAGGIVPPPRQQVARTGAGSFSGILIHGSGYGHGLGMSQWGARALAEQGMDYQQILFYFYQGVELIEWNGVLPTEMPTDWLEDSFYRPWEPGG